MVNGVEHAVRWEKVSNFMIERGLGQRALPVRGTGCMSPSLHTLC